LIALRPTYEIRVGGEKAAEIRKHLFTPFRDKFTIDVPGSDDLEMKGDLLDHEYVIEQDGDEVAAVSKRWLTIRDTYAVQIAAGIDPRWTWRWSARRRSTRRSSASRRRRGRTTRSSVGTSRGFRGVRQLTNLS
jgi:hypothetical protein